LASFSRNAICSALMPVVPAGVACAIGLAWSLFATIFFTLPAAALAEPMSIEARKLLAGT
jgi:hypothetical protein